MRAQQELDGVEGELLRVAGLDCDAARIAADFVEELLDEAGDGLRLRAFPGLHFPHGGAQMFEYGFQGVAPAHAMTKGGRWPQRAAT